VCQYNLNGNRISVTDEDGNTVNTAYDQRNRVLSITQPVDASPADNLVSYFYYDEKSNRTATKNPKGNITYYVYDERDNNTEVIYPDNKNRQIHYDGNRNVDRLFNGRGQRTVLTYDLDNRLTNRSNYDGTSVVYTYTPYDSPQSMTDKTGAYTWSYSGAHQLLSSYQPVPNATVNYTYYPGSGRRWTMSVGAQTWTYIYDSDYRLWKTTQALGATTPATYLYNSASLATQMTYGSGSYVSYVYDTTGLGRILDLNYNSSSGTLTQQIEETYDYVGIPQSYGDLLIGGTGWLDTYSYDDAYRLTNEDRVGGSSGNFYNVYKYDANGNRSQVTRNLGTPSTYQVDANDKFLSGDGYSVSAANYDGDGNPLVMSTPNGTNTLVFDSENQVVSIAYGNGQTDTFRYNGANQRVEKVDKTGTTHYIYDGATIIADTSVKGSINNYYIPGVGFVSSAGVQYYYRTNIIGSNVATTDANSNLLTRTEVDAYGNETYTSGSSPTEFQFGGKEGYVTDNHSGFDMIGRRYYIPMLGQFLTQDPKGHGAGLNLYRYCDNSPLTKLDPTGLDQYVIIAGDTKWPACLAYPYYDNLASQLRDNYQDVNTYDGPDKGTVLGIMTSNVDYVIFWGHGNRNEVWFDSGTAVNKGLTVGDVLGIAAVRKACGLGKMKCIQIDECLVCGNVALRNALLTIADRVIGYEGETFNENWPHAPGIEREYTKPAPVPKALKGRLPDGPRNYKKKT